MTTTELREMDAEICRKVMGWAEVPKPLEFVVGKVWEDFHPTESDADAMAVLRKCRERCSLIVINNNPEVSAIGATSKGVFVQHIQGENEPFNQAICKFALKLFP